MSSTSEQTSPINHSSTISSDSQTRDKRTNKSSTGPNFESKCQLHPDLSGGSLSLKQDEQILESWAFDSNSMSLAEWMGALLTCGVSYLMTRVILQRKRRYCIHVTNLNILVKEDMIETRWGIIHTLLENQVTFPISSLKFVSGEEIGKKARGLLPAAVMLEMRFGRYPVDSEYPVTIYRY